MSNVIADGEIEVSIEGQGPTASIWWRYTADNGGDEWQNAGLQMADVAGGPADDAVISAVRAQLDL